MTAKSEAISLSKALSLIAPELLAKDVEFEKAWQACFGASIQVAA